ncbi:hypothetical protein [Nocardia australiensis]|uniref:hypothetical protein n=1 Tax=Nocardia australiensis TaxID=2887191 RepID=UPI0035575143
MKIYPRNNQKTAILFLDYVRSQLPFAVETIRTDNGAEFQSAFHWHVLDKGVNHVYIKPRTPRMNGKVERSHRIDAEEFWRYRCPRGRSCPPATTRSAPPGVRWIPEWVSAPLGIPDRRQHRSCR